MPKTVMRVQSVRFSEQSWLDIQAEARREGVSASQFIREAAIARMWYLRGLRDDPSTYPFTSTPEGASTYGVRERASREADEAADVAPAERCEP